MPTVTTLKQLNVYTSERLRNAEFGRFKTETMALKAVLIATSLPFVAAMVIGVVIMVVKRPEKPLPRPVAHQSKEYEYTGGEMNLTQEKAPRVIDCGWHGPC